MDLDIQRLDYRDASLYTLLFWNSILQNQMNKIMISYKDYNGHTDLLVIIIELLRFLNCTLMLQESSINR